MNKPRGFSLPNLLARRKPVRCSLALAVIWALMVTASPMARSQPVPQRQANIELARHYCEVIAKWTTDTPHTRPPFAEVGSRGDIEARALELVLDEYFGANFGTPFDQFKDFNFLTYTALPQCLTQGPNFVNDFKIKPMDALVLRQILDERVRNKYDWYARDARKAVPEIEARIPRIETALMAADPMQALESVRLEADPFLRRAPGASARRFAELYSKAKDAPPLLAFASQRCASDREAVRALPSGLPGLHEIWLKYGQLTSFYSKLPGGVAGCAVFADLAQVRQAVLASVEPELAARFGRAAAPDEVDAIKSRYLSSPLDGGPAGARLLAMADRRSKELQAAQEAATEKERKRITTLCGLSTDGLIDAADVQLICAGEFNSVSFGRNGAKVAALVGGYVEAFASSCQVALPANKVEITEQQCTREAWTTRGGWEVAGSRHCTDYRTVGTGKFADPAVLNLHNQLQQEQSGKLLGDFFGNLNKALNDPVHFATDLIKPVLTARKDMAHLLAVNGCASKATKQFQANLVNFGSGRQGVQRSGASSR